MDQALNSTKTSDSALLVDKGFEAEGWSGIDRLASVIARNAQASAVFGEPVHQGSSVMVPVAKAAWGVGGGKGPARSGEGGGGGMYVVPVGFIHLENGRARYHPLRNSALSFGAIALLVGALMIVGRQLRHIRRDLRAGERVSSL